MRCSGWRAPIRPGCGRSPAARSAPRAAARPTACSAMTVGHGRHRADRRLAGRAGAGLPGAGRRRVIRLPPARVHGAGRAAVARCRPDSRRSRGAARPTGLRPGPGRRRPCPTESSPCPRPRDADVRVERVHAVLPRGGVRWKRGSSRWRHRSAPEGVPQPFAQVYGPPVLSSSWMASQRPNVGELTRMSTTTSCTAPRTQVTYLA